MFSRRVRHLLIVTVTAWHLSCVPHPKITPPIQHRFLFPPSIPDRDLVCVTATRCVTARELRSFIVSVGKA